MNRYLKAWLLFTGIILSATGTLEAQITVYPGDANNNGIVNNIDVLYIGYSFGTPGPSRVLTDTEFEPQEAPAVWATAFPDGTSYAYADANGDGVVGTQDLITVYRNYGSVHEPALPDEYSQAEENGSRIYLEKEKNPLLIVPGSEISIPLYLNGVDRPIDLNGLAFSLEYDDEVIREIRLKWEQNWFNADSSWYGLQIPHLEEQAQLDIVATRFGNDPVLGAGILGRVNIIIEDDLIELLPAPTDTVNVLLTIKKIRAVGKDFETLPLGGDAYTFTVYHPDAKPNHIQEPKKVLFTVYPNPAKEQLWLKSQKIVQRLVLYDLLGRPIRRVSGQDATEIQFPLTDLPPGLYLLQVQTEEGIGTREILIE